METTNFFDKNLGHIPDFEMKESLQKAIDNQKPTKLYSEIQSIIDNKHTFSPHDTNRNCQRAKLNTEIAQSIEHLVYDKLEGFGKWILIEGFEPRSDNGVKWFGKGETEYCLNELIQLYLNKES